MCQRILASIAPISAALVAAYVVASYVWPRW